MSSIRVEIAIPETPHDPPMSRTRRSCRIEIVAVDATSKAESETTPRFTPKRPRRS